MALSIAELSCTKTKVMLGIYAAHMLTNKFYLYTFIFYRRQRMAEMREAQQRNKFGEVREISKSDWVTEVNNAGDGIWVVIHVYKPS